MKQYINSSAFIKETEFVVNNLHMNKTAGPDGSLVNDIKHLRKNYQIYAVSFENRKGENTPKPLLKTSKH